MNGPGDPFEQSVHVSLRCSPTFASYIKQAMAMDGASRRTGWCRRAIASVISEKLGLPIDTILGDERDRDIIYQSQLRSRAR
jgi:hypothetical protein